MPLSTEARRHFVREYRRLRSDTRATGRPSTNTTLLSNLLYVWRAGGGEHPAELQDFLVRNLRYERQHIPMCGECGYVFPVSETINTANGEVCESCYSQFYRDYEHEDGPRSTLHQYDNGDDMPSPEGVLSWNHNAMESLDFKMLPREKKHFEEHPTHIPLYLGVEMEVECTPGEVPHDVCNKILSTFSGGRAILKYDGSLHYGFEIVSAPATLDYHRTKLWTDFYSKESWNEFRHALKAWDTNTAGMHIHASKNALGGPGQGVPLVMGRIMAFLNAPEHRDQIQKVAGRMGNQYCQYQDRVAISRAYRSRTDKYYAINNRPRDTLEFRIFRGNTRAVGLFRNLEFVQSVIEFCRVARHNPNTSAEGLALKFDDYASWLLRADNRSRFPHIYNYMIRLELISGKPTKKAILEDDDLANYAARQPRPPRRVAPRRTSANIAA